jgi:hypothetical protein
MGITLFWLEKGMLVVGILFILFGIIQYGRRSHDWAGVATIFFKRVPMSVEEFKRYRLGVSLVVMAVALRIIVLTLWPTL